MRVGVSRRLRPLRTAPRESPSWLAMGPKRHRPTRHWETTQRGRTTTRRCRSTSFAESSGGRTAPVQGPVIPLVCHSQYPGPGQSGRALGA